MNIGICFQRHKWKKRHQLLLKGHAWDWYLIATLAFSFLFLNISDDDDYMQIMIAPAHSVIPLLMLQG